MTKKCKHFKKYEMTQLPSHVFASRLFRSAEEYRAAADKIDKKEFYNAPAYFMRSHAIELYLKAYLAAHGKTKSDLSGINGHCLACLYEEALNNNLCERDDVKIKIINSLREFSTIFRYTDYVIKSVLAPSIVDDLINSFRNKIQMTVEINFLDGLRPGETYEIDTFQM